MVRAALTLAPIRETGPETLVKLALDTGAVALVSTYNEPLITAEWAVAVFQEAHRGPLADGIAGRFDDSHRHSRSGAVGVHHLNGRQSPGRRRMWQDSPSQG